MSDRENTNKNLQFLNLFFGVIIIILSVFTFFSFRADTMTQNILISIALLTSGMTFFAIGIPDNIQKTKARTTEAVVGSLISLLGLMIFFIALLIAELEQFIINILLLVYMIMLGIIGVTVSFLTIYKRDETKEKVLIVMLICGILIIVLPVVNAMGLFFELWSNEFIIILISITLFIYGISRISLYITGIYK